MAMEEVDRHRIRTNLIELIKETHYDSLIDSIERVDRQKVIPSRLLADWKNRRRNGLTIKQLNTKFYDDIQRRGPHAFQLLVDSLQNSAQQNQNLAVLLDPTLRETESESEEVPPKGYYSDEGIHYVYIDNSWQAETCFHDRQAIQQFFEAQGYTRFKDFKELEDCADDIGSLVVVNFCSLSDGGITRENDWVYEKFNKACLETKPKILLSLRYIGEKPRRIVEQDSGKNIELFRDTLQVKISLDAAKKKEGEKSEEVLHLLNILSEDNYMHLEDKMRKLQREFKKHKLYPLELLDTYFCKAFSITKKII